MRWRLDARSDDYAARLGECLASRRARNEEVGERVKGIVREVRERGWEGLVRWTRELEGGEPTRVGREEMERGWGECGEELRGALETAARRIRGWHERQKPNDVEWEEGGVILKKRWGALDSVGMYVPGGGASYMSSVLMNVIPARAAGVGRVVLSTPSRGVGVLGAAWLSGVDEFWRVGGAQAVAAMAYGAGDWVGVDKVVGPGGIWVTAAKREVYGDVGIDMLAGPSEVLVLADGSADAKWAALDMLAQAEHDEDAQAMAASDDADFLSLVERYIEEGLKGMEGKERGLVARASWERHGALVRLGDMSEGVELANEVAAEHVEVMARGGEDLAGGIRHAGAIFVGGYAAEALGDYAAGSNHVLPTTGSARFSSGLGTTDFMKSTTIVMCTKEGMMKLGGAARVMALEEGLEGHAGSLTARLEGG